MIGFLHRTQTLKLRDDRGVMFPIRSPPLKLERKADSAAVTWYRLAQVRRDSESLLSRIAGIGLIGFTAFALLWFGSEAVLGGESRRAIVLLIFVPIVITVGVIWRAQLRAALAKLEAERLELPPVCPSCRYDLAGLPAEPDGCAACPECGGAWEIPNQNPINSID